MKKEKLLGWLRWKFNMARLRFHEGFCQRRGYLFEKQNDGTVLCRLCRARLARMVL